MSSQAPPWLLGLQDYLNQGLQLGPVWSRLLSLFYEHEEAAGFPVSHIIYYSQLVLIKNYQLNAGNLTGGSVQPTCVSNWIARARIVKPRFVDTITLDEHTFRSNFEWWWAVLKPKNFDLMEPDCSLLHLPGVNGIISLVVFLLWWGTRVAGRSENAVDAWSASITEVCEAIEIMLDIEDANSKPVGLPQKRK